MGDEGKKDESEVQSMNLSLKHITEENYTTFDEKMFEKIIGISTSEEEEWQVLAPSEGVRILKRFPEGSKILQIRADIDGVKASKKTILQFYSDVKNSHKIDPTFLEGRHVQDFDANHFIVYGHWKIPWPMSNRDFVWIQCQKEMKDSAIIGCYSTIRDDVPEVKGVVRAEIIETGYYIRENKEAQTCSVTYLVQIDPKGWIPVLLINAAAADQAGTVGRLKNYFDKNPVPFEEEQEEEEKQQESETTEQKQKKKKKKKNTKNNKSPSDK